MSYQITKFANWQKRYVPVCMLMSMETLTVLQLSANFDYPRIKICLNTFDTYVPIKRHAENVPKSTA